LDNYYFYFCAITDRQKNKIEAIRKIYQSKQAHFQWSSGNLRPPKSGNIEQRKEQRKRKGRRD
jgi:hypothetical protein